MLIDGLHLGIETGCYSDIIWVHNLFCIDNWLLISNILILHWMSKNVLPNDVLILVRAGKFALGQVSIVNVTRMLYVKTQ